MFKKVLSGLVAMAVAQAVQVRAEGSDQDRITALEQQVQQLSEQIVQQGGGMRDPLAGFKFGGYGEIHANFEENGESMFDLHRLVMYVGYDFSDWIILTSETEVEHAFVTGGAGGEIAVEQLFVDFLLTDAFNIRLGRMLAPIGIVNQTHEPTTFFGVERPDVDKYIIPTTWSVDGAGIFGAPCEWLHYQASLVGGLDGSQFSADEGIRDGRIKERSGLNHPALTGRIDLYPSVELDLRLGLSGYIGGTDNANKGVASGADNDFTMYSADFEYLVSCFQFRGVVAMGENSDPQNLTAGVGEEIFGWYLEGGARVMPDAWKTGKLEEADIIPFVRYEKFDTQHKVPAAVVKDGANERSAITVGVNIPVTPQLVLKTDYQFRDNEGTSDPENLFNLGMGWAF